MPPTFFYLLVELALPSSLAYALPELLGPKIVATA
jgi:hypothetical protein